VRRALGRPRATASLVSSLGGSAVDNARQAVASLAQQIAERRSLAPSAPGLPLGPGEMATLPREECLDLLRGKTVGRMAYVARAGVPDIAPVNYVLSGSDVLVRSGPGPKLQAAERRELVAFEVDDVDDEASTGWSVVLVGRAQRLTPAQLQSLDEGELPVPWVAGPRHGVIRIRPTRITGRRLG
jgi:hypothetical protein